MFGAGHRHLKEDRKRFDDPAFAAVAGKVKATGDLDRQRSGQDRILAQKIHLYLHRASQKTAYVDVVPGLFIIAAGPIISDVYNVIFDIVT